MGRFDNLSYDRSGRDSYKKTTGFGSGYNRENNGYSKPKKHSGSKTGTGSNGVQYISGWNVSKKGFLSAISCPCKEPAYSSKGVELKKGWERWVVSCEFKSNESYKKEQTTHTGFYNIQTRKLYIPDLTMVLSPSAPNGGYFGTCRKPSKR